MLKAYMRWLQSPKLGGPLFGYDSESQSRGDFIKEPIGNITYYFGDHSITFVVLTAYNS